MKTQELEPETIVIDEIIDEEPPPRRNWESVRSLLVLLLAAASVAGWAYLFLVVRPDDQALAPDRQQAAVDAAADAAVAILSYKSDTVDTDLAAANSRVTGTFGDYYKTFTRDVVAPAAKEKKISTSATVVGKSISEFSADRASVVVFLNQSTSTADIAQPTVTSTTLRIEVERHGDTWLVSKFDPA
ncbi:twin-arginine translocation pathway signal [Antrihabitans stalactiti]|uniref:Twin-arginine translocation pathway signal n=1 Tax=Antrihabitans stalactiti TaxID=2584121 RepID=A0A848K3P4_9NOCA|nr:twin-arginine translocation pathway signal [Antrihabitans stalactiti]NMN93765.1 twin-arginine translocation pathway signal [Antrihabitans stalactiti]